MQFAPKHPPIYRHRFCTSSSKNVKQLLFNSLKMLLRKERDLDTQWVNKYKVHSVVIVSNYNSAMTWWRYVTIIWWNIYVIWSTSRANVYSTTFKLRPYLDTYIFPHNCTQFHCVLFVFCLIWFILWFPRFTSDADSIRVHCLSGIVKQTFRQYTPDQRFIQYFNFTHIFWNQCTQLRHLQMVEK